MSENAISDYEHDEIVPESVMEEQIYDEIFSFKFESETNATCFQKDLDNVTSLNTKFDRLLSLFETVARNSTSNKGHDSNGNPVSIATVSDNRISDKPLTAVRFSEIDGSATQCTSTNQDNTTFGGCSRPIVDNFDTLSLQPGQTERRDLLGLSDDFSHSDGDTLVNQCEDTSKERFTKYSSKTDILRRSKTIVD
ncbi:hypothetical protein DPMN_113878 [Dreissena polymorpha]|uniref:Uncharacterized protein n=1 Tax=Dreissena polymorpha TaxID=45954 RepID=A0A9D4KJ31_DREPO|nr:hypothetical protein DPMN_113878 [Dreissena polymorpha]